MDGARWRENPLTCGLLALRSAENFAHSTVVLRAYRCQIWDASSPQLAFHVSSAFRRTVKARRFFDVCFLFADFCEMCNILVTMIALIKSAANFQHGIVATETCRGCTQGIMYKVRVRFMH